jgi:DNA-binding response OmpR family regulator
LSILLVDDERRLRQAIARSLSARGYDVEQVGTCAEAIQAASSGRHDLMVLDINLPDGTGWDALRALDHRGRMVPTVVFSAVPPSAVRVREFRPIGVLHKPFPIDALLRFVREAERECGARGTRSGGRD